ncbi:hypothetical protein FSW04_18640 [Baekduia soli]|uniref:Uncharacterized protein n=1 Tax=Baekduia soli TaxID=496014 RepID=A0A5B8U9C3_9ACTN|nr:hypothetical protein [Baekduia soli]QEC49388.1 hypothetical protein FSW04_18640 [Baekduia soli]
MAALLGAAALLAGCGSDQPKLYGTLTDCTKIGRPTQLDDPGDDQRGRRPGDPKLTQGDLVSVRIARGPGGLCVEYRTQGTVKPAVAFVLVLRPRTAETPVVQLETTVLGAADPAAMIDTGESGASFRKVAATIGLQGDHITVLVTRAEFARLGVQKIFDAFRFQARTVAATSDGGRQTDCAPSCQ